MRITDRLRFSGGVGMNRTVKQGIDNCYMVHKHEHPGYEENRCAGLRTLKGDGETCEICKNCKLYYAFEEDDWDLVEVRNDRCRRN